MKISIIDGEVFIDGKPVKSDGSVEMRIENVGERDLHTVRIYQFEEGHQGTTKQIEVIHTEVFTSISEAPNIILCDHLPIIPKEYKWISYRGMKFEVTDRQTEAMGCDYSVTLPGEKYLREFIAKNKVPVSKKYALQIQATLKNKDDWPIRDSFDEGDNQ